MTKKLKLILLSRKETQAATVELVRNDTGVRAHAVLENADLRAVYDTPYHQDERAALADVASWLRTHIGACESRGAGGLTVAIVGDPSLTVKPAQTG